MTQGGGNIRNGLQKRRRRVSGVLDGSGGERGARGELTGKVDHAGPEAEAEAEVEAEAEADPKATRKRKWISGSRIRNENLSGERKRKQKRK